MDLRFGAVSLEYALVRPRVEQRASEGGDDLIAFERDLEDALGCSVEVLTDGGSSLYLQERILAEAATL